MFYHSTLYIKIIYHRTQQQRQRNEKNERKRREKVKKDERKMNKFFFFLAFLSVPFQNGMVLFTCDKNYEFWNIL